MIWKIENEKIFFQIMTNGPKIFRCGKKFNIDLTKKMYVNSTVMPSLLSDAQASEK